MSVNIDFHYWFTVDSDTGIVLWKNKPHKSRVVIGTEAGTTFQTGYKKVMLLGKNYLLHRIAFFLYHGYIPEQIDHINGNRSDNRKCNLRQANFAQNAQNRRLTTNNKTGYKGVSKSKNRYRATISYNKKFKHLGYFDTIEEAAKVYEKACEKFHKEYASVVKWL